MTKAISAADVQRVSTLAASAALDATQWQALLDALAGMVDGACTQIFGADETQAHLGALHSGYDPHMFDLFESYYAGINPWAEGLLRAPTGAVIDTRSICPDRLVEHTEFYADWVLPQEDVVGSGGAVIERTETGMFVFGANIRRRDREKTMPRWLELCRLIVPQMQISWQIGKAHLSQDLEIAARRGMLTESPLAVLVAGPEGQIRFANARAEAMLDAGRPIARGPTGRLHFARGAARERFHRAGRALASERFSAPEAFRLHVSRGAAERYSFAPLNPDALQDWAFARLIGLEAPSLLVAVAEEQPAGPPGKTLMQAYGLTEAEAAVALDLAAGRSLREIAGLRGVSVHTVRGQVKAAMAKCGVSRQAQLAVRVTKLSAGAAF